MKGRNMKNTIIIILCILLLLSGCDTGPNESYVIYDAEQENSQYCVIPNKDIECEVAEAIFKGIPQSSFAKDFKVQDIDFNISEGTWIVYFWEDVPEDGPAAAGSDLYIVLRKKDGKVLSIGFD